MMRIIKKIAFMTCVIVAMCAAYTATFHPAEAHAATAVDIGYYDCWRAADGVTWQGGIKPGSTITTTFSVALPTGKIKSYNVEFLDYTTGKFTSQYYNYAVDNGRIISSSISGSKVTYTIKSTLRGNVINDGLDITKNDQSELVAGKRFYMPVLITYTTASDTQKNGQYIFALGCRAAGQYINGTLYTIQDCNGNACMIKGTFVHCTGRCTGQGVK